MDNRIEETFQLIRQSEDFGEGSCSTIDECLSDDELREDIKEFFFGDDTYPDFFPPKPDATPQDYYKLRVDIEKTFWEREGLKWESKGS